MQISITDEELAASILHFAEMVQYRFFSYKIQNTKLEWMEIFKR